VKRRWIGGRPPCQVLVTPTPTQSTRRFAVITMSTLTGLLICAVMASLFVSLSGHQVTFLVATLFVLAMLTFAAAFVLFLCEVLTGTAHLANSQVRLHPKPRDRRAVAAVNAAAREQT